MAPYFNNYANSHQSPGVLYATVLMTGPSPYTCKSWAQMGGLDDTSFGIVIDDSATGKFQEWFGATRPQLIVIAPSGEFLDLAPNQVQGSYGTWTDGVTDEKYNTLLEPYFNGTVLELTPVGGDGTSTAPPVFKHMLTSTVLLLSIVACLYVQV